MRTLLFESFDILYNENKGV